MIKCQEIGCLSNISCDQDDGKWNDPWKGKKKDLPCHLEVLYCVVLSLLGSWNYTSIGSHSFHRFSSDFLSPSLQWTATDVHLGRYYSWQPSNKDRIIWS